MSKDLSMVLFFIIGIISFLWGIIDYNKRVKKFKKKGKSELDFIKYELNINNHHGSSISLIIGGIMLIIAAIGYII